MNYHEESRLRVNEDSSAKRLGMLYTSLIASKGFGKSTGSALLCVSLYNISFFKRTSTFSQGKDPRPQQSFINFAKQLSLSPKATLTLSLSPRAATLKLQKYLSTIECTSIELSTSPYRASMATKNRTASSYTSIC